MDVFDYNKSCNSKILLRVKEDLYRICRKYNLFLVVLHGSYAKNAATAKSDIDIGLLGDSNIIKEKYFDILRDFVSIFGDKFDPVFLNGAEAMITYHVAINGIPLYEKNRGLFNSFRLGALARYQDTGKFRILEKQYIKSAIKRMR
ncbi:MAG: nucleotidyltransferase domain-containing protein [Candidatus Omnitrophica bacterium]|nr:nucleotidyltransferase domain-containing protein [Candidatus Omnitrophota bacterium]